MLANYIGVALTVSGITPSVAAGATVEVRREDTGVLATIFSDEAGTIPIVQPGFVADSNGRFMFYADGLERGYKVTVTKDAFSYVLRNVAVGTAQQFNKDNLPYAPNVITNKGDIFVGTTAGASARKAVSADGYALQGQSGATDGLQYIPTSSFSLENGYLQWSVNGNELTVAVKTWATTDPSATDPVYVVFRNTTTSNGQLTKRKLTAATSITINNTATLGTTGNIAFRLWCVAFDDAGTVRLAVVNCLNNTSGSKHIMPLSGWGIASATAEDNASDAVHTFYAGAAVASKPYVALGWASWESGLGVAGVWDAAPTRVQLYGLGMPLPGMEIGSASAESGAVIVSTAQIPVDDSIPQIGEGIEILTCGYTPSSAADLLEIQYTGYGSANSADHTTFAMFVDATANALVAVGDTSGAAFKLGVNLRHRRLAGSSSFQTFRIREGVLSGQQWTHNGTVGGRLYGGVSNSILSVKELMT